MKEIFRKKTRLEKLKAQYSALMKKSYEKALRNREESQILKQRAMQIREEIQQLSYTYSDI